MSESFKYSRAEHRQLRIIAIGPDPKGKLADVVYWDPAKVPKSFFYKTTVSVCHSFDISLLDKYYLEQVS
jgi:hypothetical protein